MIKINYNTIIEKTLELKKYDILTGRKKTLTEKIGEFALNIIEKIVRFLFENIDFNKKGFDTTLIGNIFLIILIIVAIVSVVVLSYVFMKKRNLKKKTMEQIFNDLAKNNVTTKDLLNQSLEFEKNEEYIEAYRLRYIVLLWVLNKNATIELHPSKTNTQLKHEIKINLPHQYSKFEKVIEVFNFSWFGNKNLTKENYFDSVKIINLILEEK